jgi:hypothetical protein
VTNLQVYSQKIVPNFWPARKTEGGSGDFLSETSPSWFLNLPDKVCYFNYGPGKLLPHSVPKGPKSGRASLKTRKGRASLKTRKGRASSKTGEGLVIIKTSKALPFGVTNLKVCSQKIVPIFSFFLFGPGPFGPGPFGHL